MPDFLLIGAARAGTTAIYSYLRQHPQIFMTRGKEPNFFAFEGETLNIQGPGADYINNSISEMSDYNALFSEAPESAICGEASPLYLYSDRAPENIHKYIPNAPLMVVLRNPIDQAFSHFLYATKQCIETETDFTQALLLEDKRLAAGWQPLFGYSTFPRYADQLNRFFKYFPKEQMLIRTYEDFQKSPEILLKDMFEFIGADPEFKPDMSRKLNAGGVPKNQTFQNFLMKSNPITRAIGVVVPQELRLRIRDKLAQRNLAHPEQIPDAAREILHSRLDDQISTLEEMIGRDLSDWRRH
jgi:hypothetical protein